ncbi:hypothetical protein [Promicromonospora kroppenstedtii]|uniref:hypothetical protein n=1 Tax=Promicromonospora kroppenstedtii TaxID=440482 RepID=UPI00146FAF83|nr:hypothetical protein [Promicromonospora kroppenstedtii]
MSSSSSVTAASWAARGSVEAEAGKRDGFVSDGGRVSRHALEDGQPAEAAEELGLDVAVGVDADDGGGGLAGLMPDAAAPVGGVGRVGRGLEVEPLAAHAALVGAAVALGPGSVRLRRPGKVALELAPLGAG